MNNKSITVRKFSKESLATSFGKTLLNIAEGFRVNGDLLLSHRVIISNQNRNQLAQKFPESTAKHQAGAVLVISLIMLLLLTLIGATAMQTSLLEEKMAGNMRDRNIAFQAAESALRDAERDISNTAAAARNISGISDFTANCGASTTSTIDDGLCYNGPGGYGTPIWATANMTAAPSVAYGSFTNATAIADLSAQPRYLIEGFLNKPYYRITVRAQGINANTVVWLQSFYKP